MFKYLEYDIVGINEQMLSNIRYQEGWKLCKYQNNNPMQCNIN